MKQKTFKLEAMRSTRLRRERPGTRRGAVLVLVAVTLVGLLALLALAVDGGSIQRHRRLAQNAADAGAQAGAAEIFRTYTDTPTVFGAARAEATRNGYTNGTSGVHVTVTTPTSPDNFTGNQYVKVVVQDTVQTVFASIIGRSKVVVTATAWGGIISPSNVCVAILAPSGADALHMETGADMNASNCKVDVNSTDPHALDVESGSVLTATSVAVTGGKTGSGTISGPLQTGAPANPDPLASLVTPSYSTTCTPLNTNVHITNSATLSPGTYCSNSANTAALWLDGGNGDIITMNPGLYVMLGGGFRASHQGVINGTGVTILNTNGPGNNANALGVFNLETGVTVHLSAMTTGNLAGILFYTDRLAGNATTLAATNEFQTSGNSTLTGTLYFPTQPVWFHTGATTNVNGGLVALSLRESQSNTNVTFSGVGGGSGFATLKRPSIVQ